MKYICEICNKQYGTVAEAEQCEVKHKKEKEDESAKSSTEGKISDALNAFITKYKEFPNIKLMPDNQKIVSGRIASRIDDVMGSLFDLFPDDNAIETLIKLWR